MLKQLRKNLYKTDAIKLINDTWIKDLTYTITVEIFLKGVKWQYGDGIFLELTSSHSYRIFGYKDGTRYKPKNQADALIILLVYDKSILDLIEKEVI
jgi:hypothetical protein